MIVFANDVSFGIYVVYITKQIIFFKIVTSLQMARDSLRKVQLDQQNNGRNIILFDVYFGNFPNFNILIMI